MDEFLAFLAENFNSTTRVIRCLHDDAFLARNPRPDMAPKWGPRELYLEIVAD